MAKQRRRSKKTSNYKGREYDSKSHLKFKKDESTQSTNPRAVELQKKLDDAQEAGRKAEIQPMVAVQEKYAHDLVVLSLMFHIVKNIADAKKDAQFDEARKELENIKFADMNFKKNLGAYNEFKTTFKELKIVQIKTKDPKNNENDLKRLQKIEEELKKELEQKARAFDFVDKDTKSPLSFSTTEEFLDFVSPMEKLNHASDYRIDIADLEEVNAIYETPISKLGELAEKTKDLDSSHATNSAKADVASAIEQVAAVGEKVASASPTYQTMS